MLKTFFRSIKYAVHGLCGMWRSEHNFRIQIIVGIIAVTLSWLLDLEVWQRIIVLLLVVLVLVLEIVNSVLERLIDVLKSRVHPSVRDIKDMMAAAVLAASFVALVIGAILFYPALSEVMYNFLVQ